jgi:CHAT domain-containing protein
VPIHAAGTYSGSNPECCADYVVSSYTPTLAALQRAQQGTGTIPVSQVKVLLIAAERTDDPTLPVLRYVKEEIGSIKSVADIASVGVNASPISSSTSVSAGSFQSAQFVHFACHGLQDSAEPLKSAFYLSDGRLTVEQLMDLNIKGAFCAFLSACETARGDEVQSDQIIHLAATMLFMGFRSVVGTMWCVKCHTRSSY